MMMIRTSRHDYLLAMADLTSTRKHPLLGEIWLHIWDGSEHPLSPYFDIRTTSQGGRYSAYCKEERTGIERSRCNSIQCYLNTQWGNQTILRSKTNYGNNTKIILRHWCSPHKFLGEKTRKTTSYYQQAILHQAWWVQHFILRKSGVYK